MATASISGLSSGLDTATIVSQLMQLEAAPQTRLKSRLTQDQTALKALQDLNAKFVALAAAAGKLASGTGWSPVKVTTSSPEVVVTGTTGATPSNLDLTVTALAKAHQVRFDAAAANATAASGSVTIDFADAGRDDVTLTLTDQTLDGLVTALNGSATGVRATKVDVGGGQFALLVTAADTGAAATFSLRNTDGTALAIGAGQVVTAGSDTTATVGGIAVTSPTNTITAVSGLSIALGPATPLGTPISISVQRDPTSLTASVKALVDEINAAITAADSLSTYNPTTKTSGAFYGDAALRDARNRLVNAVSSSGNTTLADVGIQVDRTGKLVFDEAAFAAAYTADPEGVRDRFVTGATDGFAARIQSQATFVSHATTGTLTNRITTQSATIRDVEGRIDAWDHRLAMRRTTLERQFTALETALARMQSQGAWLAGQLGSMGASSGD